MALNDAIEEIRNGRGAVAPQADVENPPRKKREKKPMTKAEIEAYRQKMMEKEEARYLGKSAIGAAGRNPKGKKAKKSAKKRKQRKAVDNDKPVKKSRMPKMLQPLQPLYLLKIPGLPKGDCIAICYARGAGQ